MIRVWKMSTHTSCTIALIMFAIQAGDHSALAAMSIESFKNVCYSYLFLPVAYFCGTIGSGMLFQLSNHCLILYTMTLLCILI